MSMITYNNNSNNGMSCDIPWVNPPLDYFEDKSVTQQSLGSQSSSSEHSSLYYDDYSMGQPSSLEIRPSSDYLPPVTSDWMYAEQPSSGDSYFGVDSYLGDQLDSVPFDQSLTALTVPQTILPDPVPTYFELQDLSESGRQPEVQVPSPMSQNPIPLYDQSWRTDTFPEIEISEGEQDLADVSTLECNSSLPTITTMFSTATISSTPTESPVCKIEVGSNSSTFPTSYAKKPKTHTFRQRQGKQVALWQFLFYVLENPNKFDTMIVWVDKPKGIFEFSSKNKDSIARAWGAVKNNRCPMTYPKLARALRKYIESDKFITKRKRKLQYVFRPEFLQQLQSGAISRPLSTADQEKIYKCSRAQR